MSRHDLPAPPTQGKRRPSDPGGALSPPLKCLPHWLGAELWRLAQGVLAGALRASVLLLILAMPAAADFPVGRVLTVTIASVDRAKQQFTFRHEYSGDVLTARYTPSTRYMRGTFERFGPEVLQPGVRAEVLYSTPTFGEPFVARVFLLKPERARAPQNKPSRK